MVFFYTKGSGNADEAKAEHYLSEGLSVVQQGTRYTLCLQMDNWPYSAERQCIRASCLVLPRQKRQKEISVFQKCSAGSAPQCTLEQLPGFSKRVGQWSETGQTEMCSREQESEGTRKI